jgi:hypothetical protein
MLLWLGYIGTEELAMGKVITEGQRERINARRRAADRERREKWDRFRVEIESANVTRAAYAEHEARLRQAEEKARG